MNHIKTLFVLILFFNSLRGQGIIENSGRTYDFDLTGTRIAVVFTNGVEYNEATIIPGYWKNWGAEIFYVGTSEVVPSHEIGLGEKGFSFTEYEIKSDLLLDDFNPADVDVIYFPGGNSPTKLLKNHFDRISSITKSADVANKFIAAFCHGPRILIETKVIHGKKITGEVDTEEIINAGGIPLHSKAVADKNVITGNFPFLETFAVTFAKAINPGNIVRENIDTLLGELDFAISTSEHFLDKPVHKSLISRIVQAASLTIFDLSVNAYKPWEVIAVTSEVTGKHLQNIFSAAIDTFYSNEGVKEEKRKRLIDAHIPAPVYLVVTMKNNLFESRVGEFNTNELLDTKTLAISAGAFMNNLRVAADNLGLGTNMVNGLPVLLAENEIRELLNIPDELFIGGIISLGYPFQKNYPQPLRQPGENVTFK